MSVTGDRDNSVQKSIANGASNTLVAWTCTRANLQSVVIFANGALTIKTNSSGSPQETITLTSGQMIVWSLASDGLTACPFSGNVTGLYLSNSSGGAVEFTVATLENL